MSWRPEGWDASHWSLSRRDIEAYEAGASALLEALRKLERPEYHIEKADNGDLLFKTEYKTGGTWVFIPEDEEEK